MEGHIKESQLQRLGFSMDLAVSEFVASDSEILNPIQCFALCGWSCRSSGCYSWFIVSVQ